MAFFNFFGVGEHRTFDHKPIYYDPEKEHRRKYFGDVDGTNEQAAQNGEYVPGSYLRGAFRDGAYQKTSVPMKRAQTIIAIVAALLFAAILVMVVKFYSLL